MGSGGTPNLPPPGQPKQAASDEYSGGSVPNLTTFGFRNVAPPSDIYVQRDDILVILAGAVHAADTITITVRLLRADTAQTVRPGQPETYAMAEGKPVPPAAKSAEKCDYMGEVVGTIETIQFNFAVPVSTTVQPVTPFTITLAEGYLLSVSARAANAFEAGQTFVVAILNRGALNVTTTPFLLNPGAQLFADYVTINKYASWPVGRIINSHEGPGHARTILVGNPAAGAEWTTTGDVLARWRPLAVIAQLVTSATAATREVALQFTASGSKVAFNVAQTQLASLTSIYCWLASGGGGPAVAGTHVSACMGDAYLDASPAIGSQTTNIQAGDQWSGITVLVEEWLLID
jgi:hypothetical protein